MMLIEDFILEGRTNGISQAEIARIANIPERAVRREVDEARINRGQLIIGDENGYYFPADETDLIDYVRRRRASIKTSRKALYPFMKAIKGR